VGVGDRSVEGKEHEEKQHELISSEVCRIYTKKKRKYFLFPVQF